jgi:hypothetical protein
MLSPSQRPPIIRPCVYLGHTHKGSDPPNECRCSAYEDEWVILRERERERRDGVGEGGERWVAPISRRPFDPKARDFRGPCQPSWAQTRKRLLVCVQALMRICGGGRLRSSASAH